MPNQMILATMDASFAAWFSSFEECADVDIAQLALQAIFNDEIYAANKDNFDRNDLKTVIDKFKEILLRPCPQNRNASLAVYNLILIAISTRYDLKIYNLSIKKVKSTYYIMAVRCFFRIVIMKIWVLMRLTNMY